MLGMLSILCRKEGIAMALRNILKDDDPTLRKASRPVARFDERLQELIDDMIETMRANEGIGLAAPQVGILRRIFVMDLRDGAGVTVAINPEILETEGTQTASEACLSVPGKSGVVTRPQKLLLKAQDRDGQIFRMPAEGLKAVCICHEYDHLDGILYIDKVEGEVQIT